MQRPRPQIGEFDDGPYWEGCRRGELLVQRCTRCGRHVWPVLPACPDELTDTLEWVPASRTGRIASYVVYHRAYHPEFTDAVPYVCANVELPEGVRVTGNVFGPGGTMTAADVLQGDTRPDALNGRTVHLFFEDCGDDLRIPQWRLGAG